MNLSPKMTIKPDWTYEAKSSKVIISTIPSGFSPEGF